MCDILLEKSAGVMGGEGTTQGQGIMQHPEGEAPGAGRGGTLGLPRGAVPAPGADPAVEEGLRGLGAAGPEGRLTLEHLHCLGS